MCKSLLSAALYCDVSFYPDPNRSELQNLLRDYTRYVIEEASPLQRKGLSLKRAAIALLPFQWKLMTFEPQPKGKRQSTRRRSGNLTHG